MLTLEYDGTPYVGWQRQPNGVSVQSVVEDALSRFLGGTVSVRVAGRTDAGVHARGQVISFRTERDLPETAYVRGLNGLLPETVAVQHARVVPDAFDPRRWAHGKRYVYRLLPSFTRSPLRRHLCWNLPPGLDVEAMRRASRHLLGRHDFASFQAAGCAAKNTVRELSVLEIREVEDELQLRVEATAFLRHMVRNLVGTLVEVGRGRRTPESMAALLEARDRTLAGRTAPPQGLRLDEVFYDIEAGPPFKSAGEADDDDE